MWKAVWAMSLFLHCIVQNQKSWSCWYQHRQYNSIWYSSLIIFLLSEYISFITIYPTLVEMIKEYRFEKAFLNNRKIKRADSINNINCRYLLFYSFSFHCLRLPFYISGSILSYLLFQCVWSRFWQKMPNSNPGWEQQYSRRKKSILVKGEMHSMGGAPQSSRNLFFECLVSPAR